MSNAAISIEHIDFAYDRHRIYNDFSLLIPHNEIFFIMGVNGCGKTTLLKLICSFLKPDTGRIVVNGKETAEYDSKSLARCVAYVPQILNLSSDFLVKDYLAMGRTPYKKLCDSINEKDYAIVEKYATQMGIESLFDANFNTLSGGQKQNVTICRALIQETPIIVLDEPMSALDLGKQADFLSLMLRLKSLGKTIVLTSHNPNHALSVQAECSICLLDSGMILGCGTSEEVLTEKNINQVYGSQVEYDKKNNVIKFKI